jgi:glucosamine--fructose-6-phosphate aminotransferase (isomerizing)
MSGNSGDRGSRMAAEMAEQPDVIAALARRRTELIQSIRATLSGPPAGIVLIARGSSDHAAVYGRYVLEVASGRPVALAAPSLHTLYGAAVDYRGYLAVAVSQSGRTPEIVTVLERAAGSGARTVAMTNDGTSPLAKAADVHVELRAGEERAVPATKTFTAQLAAFAILAEALGPVPWTDHDWAELPGSMRRVLRDEEPASVVARGIGDAAGLLTVGRGYLFAIALEAALKLKEAAGILAQGYSAADLRHGAIAVVERGFPVLSFAARGPAEGEMVALAGELEERGARVFRAAEEGGDLPVPSGVAEPLQALPMAVRGQQVAHALALHRGLDPDAPPGLSKVTMTR